MTLDQLEELWRLVPESQTWPDIENVVIDEDDDGITVTFDDPVEQTTWVVRLVGIASIAYFAAAGLGVVALIVKVFGWLL